MLLRYKVSSYVVKVMATRQDRRNNNFVIDFKHVFDLNHSVVFYCKYFY
jgi:hypothetical protein